MKIMMIMMIMIKIMMILKISFFILLIQSSAHASKTDDNLQFCMYKCDDRLSCEPIEKKVDNIECKLSSDDYKELRYKLFKTGLDIEPPQKVNGEYGPWKMSSACTKTCGTGVEVWKRVCNSPAPRYGGICVGPEEEVRPCSTNPYPEWSEWSRWSLCTETCGEGRTSRNRTCLNLPPDESKKSDSLCPGEDRVEDKCSQRQFCCKDKTQKTQNLTLFLGTVFPNPSNEKIRKLMDGDDETVALDLKPTTFFFMPKEVVQLREIIITRSITKSVAYKAVSKTFEVEVTCKKKFERLLTNDRVLDYVICPIDFFLFKMEFGKEMTIYEIEAKGYFQKDLIDLAAWNRDHAGNDGNNQTSFVAKLQTDESIIYYAVDLRQCALINSIILNLDTSREEYANHKDIKIKVDNDQECIPLALAGIKNSVDVHTIVCQNITFTSFVRLEVHNARVLNQLVVKELNVFGFCIGETERCSFNSPRP